MPRRILKISTYIFSFLFPYILILFLSTLLAAPWNILLICASFLIFGFVTLFFLDMTLPFFNLLNPVPVRLPNSNTQSVVLTFDDGPSPFTLEILNILDQHQVKAVFFCIGENIEKHPDILSEIHKRGHEIGNHSFSHQIFPFLKSDQMKSEIQKTSSLIQNITGAKEKWFRFPKGYQSRKGFNMVQSLGLKPIGFSYPIYDVENPPAQELIDRTLNKVKAGDILLMHDGYPSFKVGSRSSLVEALPKILEGIKEKNISFIKLEELF